MFYNFYFFFIGKTAQGRKSVRGKNYFVEITWLLKKKLVFSERTITNAMYVLLPEKHENSLQHIFFSLKYSRPRISKQVRRKPQTLQVIAYP